MGLGRSWGPVLQEERKPETGRSAHLTDGWSQRMRKVLISQDFQGWLTGLEPATSRSTILKCTVRRCSRASE